MREVHINKIIDTVKICLMYEAIHGEEDRKFMPNPNNEEQFIENFNNIFNDD